MDYKETLGKLAQELVHPERHFVVPTVREVAPFHVSKLAVAQSLQSLPDNPWSHPDTDPPQSDAIAA